jgi:hypothetical protein
MSTPPAPGRGSGSLAAKASTSRLWLAAALIAVLAAFVVHYRDNLLSRVSADNSLLVWYVGAQRALNPTLVRDINTKVSATLTGKFGDGLFPFRFRQRQDYFINYPLPTLCFIAIAALLEGRGVSPARDFEAFLPLQLIYMWIPAGVIAVALLALVLAALRDRLVALAAMLSLAVLAAADHLPLYSRSLHLIWNVYFLNADGSWRPAGKIFQRVWSDVRAIPTYLLHPGPAFSPFAFEPKSNFMVLLLCCCALRWSGAYRAGYGLIAAGSLFEQGYSMLLALMLIAIDLVRDPRRVLNPLALCFCGAAIIPNLLLGAFWEQIGFPLLIAAVLGAFIVVGAAIYLARWLRTAPGAIGTVIAQGIAWALRPYDRARALFAPMSDPGADLSIFALLWIVSLLAFVPFSLASSAAQSQYYWGNIHGRLLGLGVPVVWMGVAIAALLRVRAHLGERRMLQLGSAAVIGLSALACAAAGARHDPLPRLRAEIQEYEAALLQPLQRYDRQTESYLYYAISKAIDTRRNWLSRLLPEAALDLPPPEGQARDTGGNRQ